MHCTGSAVNSDGDSDTVRCLAFRCIRVPESNYKGVKVTVLFIESTRKKFHCTGSAVQRNVPL